MKVNGLLQELEAAVFGDEHQVSRVQFRDAMTAWLASGGLGALRGGSRQGSGSYGARLKEAISGIETFADFNVNGAMLFAAGYQVEPNRGAGGEGFVAVRKGYPTIGPGHTLRVLESAAARHIAGTICGEARISDLEWSMLNPQQALVLTAEVFHTTNDHFYLMSDDQKRCMRRAAGMLIHADACDKGEAPHHFWAEHFSVIQEYDRLFGLNRAGEVINRDLTEGLPCAHMVALRSLGRALVEKTLTGRDRVFVDVEAVLTEVAEAFGLKGELAPYFPSLAPAPIVEAAEGVRPIQGGIRSAW